MRDRVHKDVFDLIQAGEFHSALTLAADGLAKSPDDPYLLYYAGLAHRRLNNYDEAVKLYKKSIHISPRNASVHLGLGIVYQLQEMYDNAIESLNEAITLDPHFPEAHNSLGLTYSKIGDYERALKCYEFAADAIIDLTYRQLVKDNEESFTSSRTTDGKRSLVVEPQAFDQIETFLKANPMWAINRNNIGSCLTAMGQKRLAREMFEESIRFTPDGMKYDAPSLALEDLANE